MEEGGWVGVGWGCFLLTVLAGVGVALLGDCFGGRGVGGLFEGRGGRASGWCMVMVLGWGGVRDGRRGNGDVRVLESGVVGREK